MVVKMWNIQELLMKKQNKVEIMVMLVVLSLINFSFYKTTDEKIVWSKSFQLGWDDFLGKPLKNSPNSAMSKVGFDFSSSFNSKDCTLEVTVTSYFTKSKSWVKEEKKSDHLLVHEQLHFDIAEIYARKFRKAVKESKLKKSNIKNKFEDISSRIGRELTEYQSLYDNETNHHINQAKQTEWNEKVAKQLEELNEYSDINLIVKVKS